MLPARNFQEKSSRPFWTSAPDSCYEQKGHHGTQNDDHMDERLNGSTFIFIPCEVCNVKKASESFDTFLSFLKIQKYTTEKGPVKKKKQCLRCFG